MDQPWPILEMTVSPRLQLFWAKPLRCRNGVRYCMVNRGINRVLWFFAYTIHIYHPPHLGTSYTSSYIDLSPACIDLTIVSIICIIVCHIALVPSLKLQLHRTWSRVVNEPLQVNMRQIRYLRSYFQIESEICRKRKEAITYKGQIRTFFAWYVPVHTHPP